jgi:hypothetical protein
MTTTFGTATMPGGSGSLAMDEQQQEKFLQFLLPALPAVFSLASSLIGRRKGIGDPTASELFADKGFWDIVRQAIPIVGRVLSSLDQPAGTSAVPAAYYR